MKQLKENTTGMKEVEKEVGVIEPTQITECLHGRHT